MRISDLQMVGTTLGCGFAAVSAFITYLAFAESSFVLFPVAFLFFIAMLLCIKIAACAGNAKKSIRMRLSFERQKQQASAVRVIYNKNIAVLILLSGAAVGSLCWILFAVLLQNGQLTIKNCVFAVPFLICSGGLVILGLKKYFKS